MNTNEHAFVLLIHVESQIDNRRIELGVPASLLPGSGEFVSIRGSLGHGSGGRVG